MFLKNEFKVLSSTSEKKSKTYVTLKKGKYYVRHNQLADDVAVSIIFKVTFRVILEFEITRFL